MIGRTVSGYRVLERLAVGGMGTVYRGEDTRSGQIVALKFPHPELLRDESARRSYLANAPAATRLDHPNIVRVREVAESDGEVFLVMDYVDAPDLRDRLAAGPLRLGELAAIGVALSSALAYAHGMNVVHRDVKPENVLIGPHGLVKLLDFDAAVLTDAVRVTVAAHELVPGTTPPYMAPELLAGAVPESSCDLFSLGAVLYEMISGYPPFADEYPSPRAAAALPALPPATPSAIQDLVMALLADDPRKRPGPVAVAATLAGYARAS